MDKKIKYISSGIIVLLFFIISYSISKSIKVDAVEKKENTYSKTVFVDIKGAVNKPGVYEVKEGSRIVDVIKKAGNLKKEADTSIINLSKKVSDEMYIIIYTKEQVELYKEKLNSSSDIASSIEDNIICPDTDNDACLNESSSLKININTASLEELSSIKGIGKTKAKKIIEYRNKNRFESVEDIKNVSGIGDSLYEKIKDNIEV